ESERRYVAQELFERLPGPGARRLDDVDALAAVRVPVDDVRNHGDLPTLAERAQGIAQAAAAADSAHPVSRGKSPPPVPKMTLLTTSQFRARGRALLAPPPAAFGGALFRSAILFFLAFALMHLLAHARGVRGDRYLLPAASLLTGLGFVMLVSLRDPLRDAMQFTS